ncbi:MAG: hypothetical protein ACI4PQ_02215 [Butyricicoccaceae bacterium]
MNQQFCHLQKQFKQQYSYIGDTLRERKIQTFFSLMRGHADSTELSTNLWGIWTDNGQYLLHCPERGDFSLRTTDFQWYQTMEHTNTDEIVIHHFLTGQIIREVAPCIGLTETKNSGVTLVMSTLTISACSDGLWISRPSPRFVSDTKIRAMVRALSRYSTKYFGLSEWRSGSRKSQMENISRMLGYDRLRLTNNINPGEMEVQWLLNEISNTAGEQTKTVSNMLMDLAQTVCILAPGCHTCPLREWCHLDGQTN